MKTLAQNNLINTKFILLTVVVFSFGFILLPQLVNAAPFDQQPVPSYSTVTSTDSVTTATVPDNLVNQWRGLYVRPATSLLTGTFNPDDKSILRPSLQQYLFSKLSNQPIKAAVKTYKFNPAEVYNWTTQISGTINAEAHDPKMVIKNDRVTEFTPPQTGKALDKYNSALKIIEKLSQGEKNIDLVVYSTQPETQLADTNNLGITELIGRGESKFNGSPANRRWNIKVGVERMTGIIIKPGEVFSFNKYLGPVDASTGFKPELVIKGDLGTIPEFGGGLCQVSSTTFRAAMHAGLPINERRNHSYAVQYYAPQGTDATIYPGAVDLKFTNDTGHSILIWPYFKEENYLVFDFYGTYDGRKVELGTPYSYDKKSDGSMKSTWKRTVTRVGQSPKNDVFNSDYQPPAKFHKKEEFPPSTTNTTPSTPTTPTEPVLAPPVDPAGVL